MNDKRIYVNMTELCVSKAPMELICLGLGSCVAIVLYDKGKKIGGLAHVVLPFVSNSVPITHPGKFANTAVKELLNQMARKGANLSMIQAKLFGGANMFSGLTNRKKKAIGTLNVEAAIEAIKSYDIKIVVKDVGGSLGRSIFFDISSGLVTLRQYAKKIIKIL